MITSKEELGAWLRLSMTHGVGNETMRRLLAAFGLPPAIFAQSSTHLRQVVTASQALALQQEPADWHALLEDTWAWLQSQQVPRAVVSLADSDYPPALLTMPDPPVLLYATGRIEALVRSHQSLLANASHELRSPLARLKMAVALYADMPEAQRAGLRLCEPQLGDHRLDLFASRLVQQRRIVDHPAYGLFRDA